MWVKTENLDLDHYVEIREEYERVNQFMVQSTIFGKWIRNCILSVIQPGLRRRYESLRVQVRFHELRLHFLESNKLPANLKVSDYLKRSELAILIHKVHTSAIAWVLLIGGMNLLYFCLGMVGYTTEQFDYMSYILTGIFFLLQVLFIGISMLLRWKMHRIFQTIM